MKKIVSVVLMLALLLTAAFAEAPMMMAGGWQVGESANREVMEAYEKAFEGFAGASYDPQMLVATQVVAGTNYCFLAKKTLVTAEPVQGWALVYIYIDLEGNASLLRIQDLDTDELGLAGGWNIPEDVDTETNDLLWNAMNDGKNGYDIMGILGNQVVAGMNYKMFCAATTEEGYTNQWAIVTVYVDLAGNATVTNVEEVVISAFEDAE